MKKGKKKASQENISLFHVHSHNQNIIGELSKRNRAVASLFSQRVIAVASSITKYASRSEFEVRSSFFSFFFFFFPFPPSYHRMRSIPPCFFSPFCLPFVVSPWIGSKIVSAHCCPASNDRRITCGTHIFSTHSNCCLICFSKELEDSLKRLLSALATLANALVTAPSRRRHKAFEYFLRALQKVCVFCERFVRQGELLSETQL